MKRVLTALAATLPFAANAADAISGAVQRQPTNWQAIVMFLIFVIFTLGITYWASKRVRSRNDYYTAGGNITGFQNGGTARSWPFCTGRQRNGSDPRDRGQRVDY